MRKFIFNPEGELRSGWKAVGFVLIFLIAAKGLMVLSRLLPAFGALARKGGVWTPALLGGLVSVLCVVLEGRHPLDFGLRFDRRWLMEFLLGTAGGVLLLGAVALAIRPSGAFHWVRNPAMDLPKLALWAGLYLGVAFNEEILFRGYLFQRLAKGGLGVWGTQALFALFFAAGHWSNPNNTGMVIKAWATVNIALAALLLGFAQLRTGSLALPIGLHLGWNWTQGSLLGFNVSGTSSPGVWTPVLEPSRPVWVNGGAFGLEATLSCALLCTLAILLLARWRGVPATPSPSETA